MTDRSPRAPSRDGVATAGRPRLRRILGLALPIIGGMVSQNVLNLVDTAMVGTLGDEALAAVGFGSFLNFLTSAFVLGLGTGVQAMASRRVGEGAHGETAIPLNGGLVLAVAIAVPWSALLVWLTPSFYPYLNDDPGVVAAGIPYLQARLFGMAALGMNFAFRGYWNATDRSALYMRTIVVMHVVNIALNWVLIFGKLGAPELGATGAGVASAIAMWVGTLMYFGLGLRHAREAGFLRGIPTRASVATMLRVSAPTGVQQMFFAAGMTIFFWIVGLIGTPQLAATQVVVQLLLVGMLPALGFGLAAASLVGQALGRGHPEDAKLWGWQVARVAFVVVLCIAAPAMIAPELFLRGFIHDTETLAIAITPMRLVAALLPLDAVGMVLMHGLMGAGDTRRTMIVSVGLQWVLFLPASYVLGPTLGFGLVAIWAANVIYRQIQGAIFAVLWHKGAWTDVEI
ncbi:MAG: MATE family efflux transporter [Polyangiales bacterium]